MKVGPMPADKHWFEYENYRRHPRYLGLSEEERAIVEQFNAEGCYLFRGAIGDGTVEKVNEALDGWTVANIKALAANKKADGTYPRLIGLHDEIPEINALFAEPTIVKLQELLFGLGPSLRTTITFLQGSQQPLHRDIPVFHAVPGEPYFRVWIALEETTPQNGTLTGVKGAHRIAAERYGLPHRFYERFDTMPPQDPGAWRRYQETLKRQYEAAGLSEEAFAFRGGDVLIWHPLFPHGGSVIENRRSSRRSVVLHVSALPPR